MQPSWILLVEDDSNDVFFIQDALRRAGVEVRLQVASDGQEAIDQIMEAYHPLKDRSTSPPAVVLLDLNLPRRTGLDVLKWIRQESPWKTVVVIVLTSSTSEADMHQAYVLGANSYIVKPTDATKLREICQLLRGYWLGWNQNPPIGIVAS